MKIALIISDISLAGGTERAVVTLANMLSRKNYTIEILSLTKSLNSKPYYETESNVTIKFLENPPLPKSLLSKIKWCIKTISSLRKHFIQNNYQIVVSTGHNNNWLLPFLKGNLKNTKLIACEHIVYESIPRVSKLFMSTTYWLLDAIVVLSEKARHGFSKYKNVVVIPNALPFANNFISNLNNKQILIVGRLSPEKGLERLIPIGIYLKKHFDDWKIIVVGDGNDRNHLEDLIAESNLFDTILLVGSSSNVEKYYKTSSIYIMTSHFEAFPMVLIEAQSFGLPIISFDCPDGPAQIISNGHDGYLISNNNEKEFNEKLSMLIFNEKERKEMGKNAEISSRKFAEDVIFEKWKALFDNMLTNI